jgi:tetratricopeptide (TPR) repeat protein
VSSKGGGEDEGFGDSYKTLSVNRYSKIGIVLVFVAVVAFGLWQVLPQAAAALPGRVRQYIPAEVLALVTTPLPTALPAPLLPPTAIATPLPTATAVPFATTVSPTQDGSSNATMPATPSPLPSPTTSPTATTTPTPAAAPHALIEGLSIIPQKFNNCGPTNLTMVLNYYGVAVDQFDVAAVVRQNYEDRNVSPEELAGYVREQAGLAAAVFRGGELWMLKQLLAAGFPVIIEKGLIPDEETGWMGHYLTLYGYDDAESAFLALDTFLGPWNADERRWEPYESVAAYWQQFNHTFLVVYRPEQEAQVKEIVGATMGDAAAMWARAAEQAQQAIEANEQNAFAWFNRGTALTYLAQLSDEGGVYEQAAAAFDQARLIGLPPRMLWYQFQPYEAYLAVGRAEDVVVLVEATLASQGGRNVEETYLYQGHALLAQGDVAGATAAYRHAASLNPNFVAVQEALAALNNS